MRPRFPTRPAAFLALALAFATPTAQAEWRDIPYAKVASMPLTLAKVDPQRVYTMRFKARPAKGQAALPADFRMQLNVDGKVVPVAVSPDGRIELPIRKDWADAGAILRVNQPKDVVAIEMNVESRVPAGVRMSYAQLTESAPIMERGIREMAGLMSFMAPDVKALSLKFEKPQETAVLTLPNGQKKSWRGDAKGHIELPWEPKWAAGIVELSAPLSSIGPIVK